MSLKCLFCDLQTTDFDETDGMCKAVNFIYCLSWFSGFENSVTEKSREKKMEKKIRNIVFSEAKKKLLRV